MCLDSRDHSPKHGCRNHMHFIEKNESPFSGCEEIHHLLGFVRSIVGVGYHRICRNDDTAVSCELDVQPTFNEFSIDR